MLTLVISGNSGIKMSCTFSLHSVVSTELFRYRNQLKLLGLTKEAQIPNTHKHLPALQSHII